MKSSFVMFLLISWEALFLNFKIMTLEQSFRPYDRQIWPCSEILFNFIITCYFWVSCCICYRFKPMFTIICHCLLSKRYCHSEHPLQIRFILSDLWCNNFSLLEVTHASSPSILVGCWLRKVVEARWSSSIHKTVPIM